MSQQLYLYGGDRPWDSSQWVTTDDRVRGGSSQSHLSISTSQTARFHGHLDTKTLGGAGFASQRSAGVLDLDLSSYKEGIVVSVIKADGKRYALTLKDEIPPPRDDGREQSGISWEAEFVVDKSFEPVDVSLPWSAFRPTYRGRPKNDAEPLDLKSIKRVGLMMRSFFGDQEGDFSLEIRAIAARMKMEDGDDAVKSGDERNLECVNGGEDDDDDDDDPKAFVSSTKQHKQRSWLRSLLCW